MGKNIYTLIFLFISTFLFGQNKSVQNKANYTPQDLKDFDGKAAWEMAKQKARDPKGQQEIFESLKLRHVQHQKALKNPVVTNNNTNLKVVNPISPYSAYCPNVGFENFNFSNWVGGTWSNSMYSDWPTVTPTWSLGIVTMGNNNPVQALSSGFVSPTQNRFTIMTIPPTINNPPNNVIGWDSIAINPITHLSDIPFVSPFSNGSTVRIGNANTGAETEELSYSMAVSAQNSQFTFSYAVVLNSGSHIPSEQPFFNISIIDQAGNPIPGCGSYNVDATGAASDPTFNHAVYFDTFSNQWLSSFDTTYYKKWTTVGVDLTAYIGQTVTITFRTADCSQGGHYGYAYVDASCTPAIALVNMCQSVNTQQVIGPSGYVSYQWYGPNSQTNAIPAPQGTGDTLVVTNGTLGDTYYVTAVSANGCTATMEAILQYSQIGVLFTNSTPSCQGGSGGTASIIATGSPTGSYIYNWLNSSGQTVGTTQQATGLAPGTYSVHVASSVASCGSFDTVVTVNIAPPITLSQTKNFCGSAAYLTAPAGSTGIQWYSPGGVLIPAPQGTNDTILAVGAANNQVYSVTYNNGGCKDSLLITLTQVPGGTLSHSGLQNICVGATNGQATINLSTTAVPPYNYSVSGPAFNNTFPASTNTIIPLTGLAYGSYTVSAFDGTCFYSDVFKIDTIPVPVSITVAPTTLCGSNNGSAIMTFTFNSAPPTLCQTTTMACLNPQQFTCGPSNTVTPSSFDYPTPYGNYYTKMRAQYIYTASELNTAGINAGNLSSIGFNITNLNTSITSYPDFNISIGCSGQSSFSPTSDQTSLITGLTNVYSNASANITLGLNTYNFTQPYSWDGVSNLIVDVCFEVPGTFSYTSNAQVSCTSTGNYSSLTITSDTDPTCNLNPTAFYGAYPIQMRPVATFGWCSAIANASMYSFNLNPNVGIIPAGSGITTPTTSLQPTSTKQYTLTTTSNYGGCTKKDTFTIFVVAPFVINMPNPDTLLCTNSSTQMLNPIFTNSLGNNVQEQAVWSTHNNLPGLTNTNAFGAATFNPAVADTGKYYLVLTAGGGCQVKDSILYRVYPYKSAQIMVPDSLFCINDLSVQIPAVSPGGIWSGPGISNTGIFSPQAAGVTNPYVTIKYVVNKGTPCEDSSTAQMKVFSNPTISFTTDTTQGCAPVTSIWFSSTTSPLPANGTYYWYFSDGQTSSSPNVSHVYVIPGTYSPKLVYIDVNGCRDSAIHTNSIIVHPRPQASFYANPASTDILSPHVDFINTTVPTNCIWAWNIANVDTSSSKNTSHDFDVQGNYNILLYATNQYNCKDTFLLDLRINGAYALYIPSGFTPNHDELNEVFKPEGFGLADNNIGYKMEIFDRWGASMFQTTDVNSGWDGTKNGIVLEEGTYVYSVTFKDYQNVSHSVKGTVTLIK